MNLYSMWFPPRSSISSLRECGRWTSRGKQKKVGGTDKHFSPYYLDGFANWDDMKDNEMSKRTSRILTDLLVHKLLDKVWEINTINNDMWSESFHLKLFRVWWLTPNILTTELWWCSGKVGCRNILEILDTDFTNFQISNILECLLTNANCKSLCC